MFRILIRINVNRTFKNVHVSVHTRTYSKLFQHCTLQHTQYRPKTSVTHIIPHSVALHGC